MTIFVFPGQGSQFTSMSKDFYDNFDIAKKTLEEIEDSTKLDLKKVIFENHEDKLNITSFTQISIFAASTMIFKTLENEKGIKPRVMLGHSLGEYTALACSQKITLEDSSIILKERGKLMNNAVKPNVTGMAALIGKNVKEIETIISDNSLSLEIANDNSPLQVVISGEISEIEKNRDLFLKNNVKKFVKLNVSAAFHSKFMLEAQSKLNEYINNLNIFDNHIKIISNFSALPSNNIIDLKKALKNQMANRVRWTESIKNLEKLQELDIIEIGPGKVLSGLIKRISNNFDIKSINNISDINTI